MPAPGSLSDARAILGNDVLGPEEVAVAFGAATTATLPEIPFSHAELVAARAAGEMLVLRVTHAGNALPLTLLHMMERFPDVFDQKLLRKMGYQLKEDWGIASEPLAGTATCAPGWALARKEILDESRNLTYEFQEPALRRYADTVGATATAVRRRSGIEAVYDTLLFFVTRNVRLLANTWDWSSSRTLDGGYLNVGGFGANGLQILSFSRAVRHGDLGVCPTRQKG